MKNSIVSLSSLCLFFVLFGCAKPVQPSVKFNLNRPFGLKVGQTGEFAENQGFAITFDKVSSDSRCPKGVQCITAGKADVALTLGKDGAKQTLTLPFTLPNGTSNVTEFNGYTIRIVGVSPFKFKDKEIKPEDYVVTLLVLETAALQK